MTGDLVRGLVVVALIAATGLFTLAEYSLVTARRWRLEQRLAEGDRRAATVLRLMDQPLRFIATVQLGVGGLSILIGAIGEPTLRSVLAPMLPAELAFLVGIGVITFLTVLLGDLVPKAVALERAERVALALALAISWLGRLLRPVVWALQSSANLVLRPFGIDPPQAQVMALSEDDLRGILSEAEATGVIEEADEEALYRVFDFASAEAHQVMVPRASVAALDASLTLEAALESVVDAPFSWHPVCDGDLDHVVGVVALRDVLTAVHRGTSAGAKIATLMRPVSTVPASQDLGALLADFRHRHQRLAMVADPAGVIVGIVTLEDVVESLVGEVAAEYDLPDESVRTLDARTVQIAGTFPIDDFNDRFAAALPVTRFHTLAGLVFDRLGRVAVAGDEIDLGEVQLLVHAVEGPRIRLLNARFAAPPPEAVLPPS